MRSWLLLALLLIVGGCTASTARTPAVGATLGIERAPLRSPDDGRIASRAGARDALVDAAPVGVAAASSITGIEVPRLALDRSRISLPEGRSLVEVELPPGKLVALGVFGPQRALLGFDIVGPAAIAFVRAHGALDEDGLLPHVTSFRVPAGVGWATVAVDASAPVELGRTVADVDAGTAPTLKQLRLGLLSPRPLIGLPTPSTRDDGYFLQSPGRYQFLRVDVVAALTAAFRQTRIRFKRDPIALADLSQWDGGRPASDVGKPRHISHEGGRDIDLALPATDGDPSTVRPHCSGVLVEADVQGCSPGTARGVDALRLAYLLGLLIDGPPENGIEKIFTDEVYVREIRKAAEELKERRWIKDAGFAGLSEEGVVRASPWHTDHVHVRFGGEPGRPAW